MYFIKRPRVIIYNIVLVLCFVASVTFSSIAQSYTVSGNVISSENNAQIEFATVKLLNVQDSSLYRAMYADSSGAFLFEEIDCNKSFVLKVAHIGYESLYKNSKSSVNCERIKFGALKLKIDRTLNLEEVKVQAQIDVLKAGIDKKVYNVGEDISVKGGTANDVAWHAAKLAVLCTSICRLPSLTPAARTSPSGSRPLCTHTRVRDL